MGYAIIYSPNDPIVPGRVTSYLQDIDEPVYANTPNALVDVPLDQVSGLDSSQWKVNNGLVIPQTSSDILRLKIFFGQLSEPLPLVSEFLFSGVVNGQSQIIVKNIKKLIHFHYHAVMGDIAFSSDQAMNLGDISNLFSGDPIVYFQVSKNGILTVENKNKNTSLYLYIKGEYS